MSSIFRLHVSTSFFCINCEIASAMDSSEKACSSSIARADSARRSRWFLRKLRTPFVTRIVSYTPKPYWYSIFESGMVAPSMGATFPFFEKYLYSILVGREGLEPSRLAAYGPKPYAYTIPPPARRPHPIVKALSCPHTYVHVRPVGFEPTTVRLRGDCSTN